MNRRFTQIASAVLAVALMIPYTGAARSKENETEKMMLRVGLASSSSHNSLGELVGANLWNNDGYGSGYRFGYFDEELEFVELARTDEDTEQISVIKTQNTWHKDGNRDSYSNEDNGGTVIGCYHIQMGEEVYDDYESAVEAADEYEGFVAWIDGEYQVRYGAYTTKDDALLDMEELGEGTVVGTSSYGINVIVTGTDEILFQFDDGEGSALGVMPDVTGADDVRTWFWDIKYRGGFRYQRINGRNLTVVNIVELEDYIKGVAPYEMGRNWPLEALKTQATCARTYALGRLNHHKSLGFDVCNSDNCQVYYGVGSKNTNWGPTKTSDRAVEESAGEVVWYENELALTLYSSSHGGASEDIVNVWTWNKPGAYPYLCGVIDPYEEDAADINARSSWSVTYTVNELTKRLHGQGFGMSTEVEELELLYSDLGNVIKLVVHWANGQSNTFKPSDGDNSIRKVFGVDSIRFVVNDERVTGSAGPVEGPFRVNGDEKKESTEGLYVISGNGTVAALNQEIYVIDGDGDIEPLFEEDDSEDKPMGGTVYVSGKKYEFEGSGWGHQMGMSQFGAYAMAEQGFKYDEICEFYYPGTKVGPYQ